MARTCSNWRRADEIEKSTLPEKYLPEIFDAIAESERCNKIIGFVAIGTINVNTALVDKVSGNFTVSASIRVDVSQIIDGFPEVIAAIGPIQVRSQGLEDNEAEKNALVKAGEKAANLYD